MKFTKRHFMKMAINLSLKTNPLVGGPFGAVVVKKGKVIGKGVNQVVGNNDPTAHAEIQAIRMAAQKLKNFDLQGAEIYTSCEPCPMCLAAIYWARISKIYYANTREDAAQIDFDDAFIYDELEKPIKSRKIPTTQMLHNEGKRAFIKWFKNPKRVQY